MKLLWFVEWKKKKQNKQQQKKKKKKTPEAAALYGEAWYMYGDTKSRVRGENTVVFPTDNGDPDIKNGSVGFIYYKRLLETRSRSETKCKI